MALPIEQFCRQQRFTSEHPAWRIQARNRGQHHIAERQDRRGWHIVAALTLGGLLDRLDQIEAGRRASRRPDTNDDDRRALDDLDQAYGNDYDLAVARSRWMACGLGTRRWLVASCAAELGRLIAADAAPR